MSVYLTAYVHSRSCSRELRSGEHGAEHAFVGLLLCIWHKHVDGGHGRVADDGVDGEEVLEVFSATVKGPVGAPRSIVAEHLASFIGSECEEDRLICVGDPGAHKQEPLFAHCLREVFALKH